MASARSLGLHEPSALPYLIAESILPPDPPASQYKWRNFTFYDAEINEDVEEELLIAERCVVWSRSGVVQRVYNLDAEGEPVLEAFTTEFSVSRGNGSNKRSQPPSGLQDPLFAQKNGLLGSKKDTEHGISSTTAPYASHSSSVGASHDKLERALVVILRSQAHVFLRSGDTHVVPLSFEVAAAFPMMRGFLMQRRLANNETEVDPTGLTPHNSFRESAVARQIKKEHDNLSRPSLMLSEGIESRWIRTIDPTGFMPRTFYFTEILSEVGLIVSGSSQTKRDIVPQFINDQPLSMDERIIYVSSHDEFHPRTVPEDENVCLAVTVNTTASTLTFWQIILHKPLGSISPSQRRKLDRKDSIKRRKSSNVFGRAAGGATPAARAGNQLRESFGPLAQTFVENVPYQEGLEPKLSKVEDLVSELGAEFGSVGVQTRSARRVSSMLARSDLAMGHERNTFNDLPPGQASRKSMSRSIRRGGSIGGFSERQSFGARRKSSFLGNGSVASIGTSFLGVPHYPSMDDQEARNNLFGLDGSNLSTMVSELPREVRFAKIKTLPYTGKKDSKAEATHDLEVFTLTSPKNLNPEDASIRELSVCIMNRTLQEMTIVDFSVVSEFGESQKNERPYLTNRIKAVNMRRSFIVLDACKIRDGPVNRILLWTQTRDGTGTLQLEAPWTSPFRVDLPAQYVVYDPYSTLVSGSPERRRETGLNRTIRNSSTPIAGLKSVTTQSQFVIIDHEQNGHRIQLPLRPLDAQVNRIISVCDFVLPGPKTDALLLAWWEVLRWLRTQQDQEQTEWTALVVVIFAIAVPFIDDKRGAASLTQRRKKNSLLRSSSGTTVDLSNWTNILHDENIGSNPTWADRGGWKWMSQTLRSHSAQANPPASPTRSRKSISSTGLDGDSKNSSIIQSVALARDFLQTPAGEAAIGPEGYLPTAMNKTREIRKQAVTAILQGLHLAREEQKLNAFDNSTSHSNLHDMAPVLAQLGQWLGWEAWTWKEGTYYSDEIYDREQWLFEESTITALAMPVQPFQPPAIFEYLESCIKGARTSPFPTLLDVAGHHGSHSKNSSLRQSAAALTPRTFALLSFMAQIGQRDSNLSVVQNMLSCGINRRMFDTLPEGVAAAFHKAITSQAIRTMSSSSNFMLDRDEMPKEQKLVRGKSRPHLNPIHEASRDYHSIGNLALESESLHLWDASSEVDRQSIIRLIFRDDRRFQEASKLVNQTRPPLVECNPEPEWTEADLLDAQKELVQFVTRRTLSVAAGRGMMHFNARVPLLTERVPIPAFSLQCVMKSRHGHGTESSQVGMTFSADKAAFTEDKVCWAFFHNGASSGLMISREAKGIDTSWILYNKPPELTNRHAGFLLALGLNGHLKNLAKWLAFKYLTPKHTMTSIGILLGLSASYLGTMDTMITRLLSVHVTRLLPVGAAELNLSGLVQTSGIVGVGLVYWGSGHRRMSEVMISEIESCEADEVGASTGATTAATGGEEGILRDEGYRLAAGFSLGLINLGKGKSLAGLRDMGVLERLLSVAVGTKNIDFVNVLDRATAGAVIAVALVWLKTNDETVAKKIDIPDTVHQFDYVRPDIFLLRTLARHLILWHKIEATPSFVEKSLPEAYRHRASLVSTKYLSTEDMPFFNIVAGICFAVGLRFAGSMDLKVRDLLVSYLDQFIRLTRLPALNYDAKLTQNSIRNCQDVVALATAAVMAGSGDLVVLRRLRSLHGRTDAETPYGSHLAGHMAIGALFLGGGTATFGTSNLAVAALVMSFYPVFPTSVLDNKGHLQALRHFWVLAVESRCVVGREVGTGRALGVEMTVKMKSGEERIITAPGLLPDLAEVEKLEVKGGEYWDVQLDFSQPATRDMFEKDQSVWLRRRAAYDRPVGEVFVAELQALDEASEVPSVHSMGVASGWKAGPARNSFEWLFGLSALKDFDHAERALVLPPQAQGWSSGERLLVGSVVDTRLELEKGILDEERAWVAMNRDQLWQLRLLFAWVDRWDEEETRGVQDEHIITGSGTWLRREVIDRLRWRVWQMTGGATEQEMQLE